MTGTNIIHILTAFSSSKNFHSLKAPNRVAPVAKGPPEQVPLQGTALHMPTYEFAQLLALAMQFKF